MKRLVTLMMCAVSLGAAAQITYPYNPDGNADGDIAVGDLQDFLVTYGNPFSPSEIMVGDSSLTYWVEQLSQTVQEQQEMIDSINQMRNFRFGPREILTIGPDDWVQVPSFDGRVGWEFNPDVDGIFTALKSGNYGGVFSIVPDEVSFDDLVNLSESDILEYTDANPTLAVRANEKVLVTGIQDVVNFPFSHTVHFLSFDGVIGDSGDVPSGPCQGEFTVNYHGYNYELVEIGDQCWFAENCRYLPQVSPSNLGYENDGAAHAYVYGYEGLFVDEAIGSFMYNSLGALYNRKAAVEDWQLCPSGWSVTSMQDWEELQDYIAPASTGEAVMSGWHNLSGLNIELAGVRTSFAGAENFLSETGFWITGVEAQGDNFLHIRFNSAAQLQFVSNNQSNGHSIRCIKDAE